MKDIFALFGPEKDQNFVKSRILIGSQLTGHRVCFTWKKYSEWDKKSYYWLPLFLYEGGTESTICVWSEKVVLVQLES